MEYFNVNGIRLAARVIGEGEPILFIHGFPLSCRLWEDVVAPLKGEYRLIMPDLRGMGHSEVTEEATFATYCDDLAGLLDVLGETRPVVVVGLSMGGYLSFEFYRKYEDRIRALVLVDTRAEADPPEKVEDRKLMAEQVAKEGCGVVSDAMLDKLFAARASDELRQTWHEIIVGTHPKGVIAALHAMAGRADSIETLGNIKVPTLVVVGEEDELTPPDAARTMHQGISGALIKVVPDCGHMTPVEKPQAFVRALREFLKSLPA